jgi:hypothetical protein
VDSDRTVDKFRIDWKLFLEKNIAQPKGVNVNVEQTSSPTFMNMDYIVILKIY